MITSKLHFFLLLFAVVIVVVVAIHFSLCLERIDF